MAERDAFSRLSDAFARLDAMDDAAATQALAEIDATDPTLAAALRPLLANRDAAADAFPDSDGQEDPLLGLELGGYRLVRLLGEGGMGRVFLGERQGPGFQQQVAVKVLPSAWSTSDARDRFQRECGILCRLEHPNLPRFIDGGVAVDGTSFLIMEYIDGQPWAEAVAKANRPQRLQWFGELCEAVRFAHQHLIVHRDIKPNNILIHREGRAMLLDFGIAKVLAPDEEADQTALRRMTPRYASPEQLRGETLGTAADVFALGAILYELVGDTPFPGAQAYHAALPSLGRGDLDAILAKALATDWQQRYETAGALADDLARYQANEPVSARKPNLSYLVGKLMARHRVVIACVLLAVLSLFAALGWSIVQERRAEAARDKALLAQQRQEQVTRFLLGLFEAVDPESMDASFSIDQVLQQGQRRVVEDLTGQPALQAQVHVALGELFLKLNRYGEASRQIDAYRELVENPYSDMETWLRGSAIQAETVIYRDDVDGAIQALTTLIPMAEEAQSTAKLGSLYNLLGLAHTKLSAWGAADEAFENAHRVLSACAGEVCAEEWILTYLNQGTSLIERNRLNEARAIFEQAAQLNRATVDKEGLDLAIQSNLAVVYIKTGSPAQAIDSYHSIIRLREQFLSPDSPKLATNHQNLAHAYMQNGDYDRAASHFQNAYRLYALEDTFYMAFPLVGLGKLYLAQDDLVRAERYAREALAILERTADEGIYLAQSQLVLSQVLAAAERWSEARQFGEAARTILVRDLGEEHPLSRLATNLANTEPKP